MNHPWQQPIRPLKVMLHKCPDVWRIVLFIRPTQCGWEVIDGYGHLFDQEDALIDLAD